MLDPSIHHSSHSQGAALYNCPPCDVKRFKNHKVATPLERLPTDLWPKITEYLIENPAFEGIHAFATGSM